MASRARRSVTHPSYKENDSFIDELLASPPAKASATPSKATPRRSRGRPRKISESDSSIDTNDRDAKYAIVTNQYPKIVLEDIRLNSNLKENMPKIVTPRRGRRSRHKPVALEDFEDSTRKLKKLQVQNDHSDSEQSNGDRMEKPTLLFTEDDVEGKKIFGFKMMHRKNDLLKKAIESQTPPKYRPASLPSSPRTPKSVLKSTNANTPKSNKRVSIQPNPSHFTPKSLTYSDSNIQKTPRSLRKKMQKQLAMLVREESEGSDFSESDSEYCPSSEESEDEKVESEEETDDSTPSEAYENSTISIKVNKKITKTASKAYSLRIRGGKDTNFYMKSDKYFTLNSNKKVVTSNHTMERLKNPRLTEEKLQTILKDYVISPQHQTAIKELLEDHKKLFDKWFYFLSEGYSILLYGVGSKERIIGEFQKEKLSNYACVVINGFFPSLTYKDVLEPIMVDLLELPLVPSNIYEAISQIEEEMSQMPDEHIFLLVHNIDGALLKNHKSQHILSKLAKIKNIHLIASIDHINTPLYWDHAILNDYNFSWWDATTMLPYTNETSYEGNLLVHKSGTLALSSLKSVFNSLTTNAKGIFIIIVKNQLQNGKTPHYQGISFKNLYWTSRESFLVSSDQALRAQLTEFLDHKLVKCRRSADGAENLLVPIENSLLQQFFEEQETE